MSSPKSRPTDYARKRLSQLRPGDTVLSSFETYELDFLELNGYKYQRVALRQIFPGDGTTRLEGKILASVRGETRTWIAPVGHITHAWIEDPVNGGNIFYLLENDLGVPQALPVGSLDQLRSRFRRDTCPTKPSDT